MDWNSLAYAGHIQGLALTLRRSDSFRPPCKSFSDCECGPPIGAVRESGEAAKDCELGGSGLDCGRNGGGKDANGKHSLGAGGARGGSGGGGAGALVRGG